MGRAAAILAAAPMAMALACAQTEAPKLLNPFADPFVQATAGRSCPPPLGPAYTEAEIRVEAHSRIERGTTCWLADRMLIA